MKEHKDKGNVSLKEFFRFARYGIGIIGIILSVLLSICSASLLIAMSFTVGEWTNEKPEDQEDSEWYRYFILAVFLYVIISFLRCFIVAIT